MLLSPRARCFGRLDTFPGVHVVAFNSNVDLQGAQQSALGVA